jgi:hypothetical protein
MRAREFIVEYDQGKTWQTYGKKLVASVLRDRDEIGQKARHYEDLIDKEERDAQWDDRPVDQKAIRANQVYLEQVALEALKAIEAADPTPNKQYTQWLVRAYINDIFRYLEDVTSEGGPFLANYHELKTRRQLDTALSDINRVKTREQYQQAYNYVSQAAAQLVDKSEAEEKRDKMKTESKAREVVNNAEVRVIVPENEAAACYYGQGTQWCTASTVSFNYYDSYAKNGDLYILIPKKPQYEGEKYQIHFDQNSLQITFMDETDTEVEGGMDSLFSRFPSLNAEFWREQEPEVTSGHLSFNPGKWEVVEQVVDALWETVKDNYLSDFKDDWKTRWREEVEMTYDDEDEEEQEAALADFDSEWASGIHDESKAFDDFANDLRYFFTDQTNIDAFVESGSGDDTNLGAQFGRNTDEYRDWALAYLQHIDDMAEFMATRAGREFNESNFPGIRHGYYPEDLLDDLNLYQYYTRVRPLKLHLNDETGKVENATY